MLDAEGTHRRTSGRRKNTTNNAQSSRPTPNARAVPVADLHRHLALLMNVYTPYIQAHNDSIH